MVLMCVQCNRQVPGLPDMPEGVSLLCPDCQPEDRRRRDYHLILERILIPVSGPNPEAWEFEKAVRRLKQAIVARQRKRAFEDELSRHTHIPGMPDNVARACFFHYKGYSLREIQKEMGLDNPMQAAKLIKDGGLMFQQLLRKHGGHYGRHEMAREEMGLGPNYNRMDRRALRDLEQEPAPGERGTRVRGSGSMGEQEEKMK